MIFAIGNVRVKPRLTYDRYVWKCSIWIAGVWTVGFGYQPMDAFAEWASDVYQKKEYINAPLRSL